MDKQVIQGPDGNLMVLEITADAEVIPGDPPQEEEE